MGTSRNLLPKNTNQSQIKAANTPLQQNMTNTLNRVFRTSDNLSQGHFNMPFITQISKTPSTTSLQASPAASRQVSTCLVLPSARQSANIGPTFCKSHNRRYNHSLRPPSLNLEGIRTSFENSSYDIKNSNFRTSTQNEIIPGKLYLSSQEQARNPEFIKSRGITAILSVTVKPLPAEYVHETGVEYLHIHAFDNVHFDLAQYFERAIEYIKNEEVVLVHCHAGVSRSATLCSAYLMSENSWDLNRTLEFLQSKRSVVAPNFSFLGQLQSFSQACGIEGMTHRPT